MTKYLHSATSQRTVEVESSGAVDGVSILARSPHDTVKTYLSAAEALNIAVALLAYVKKEGAPVSHGECISRNDYLIDAVDTLLNILSKRRDKPEFKDDF